MSNGYRKIVNLAGGACVITGDDGCGVLIVSTRSDNNNPAVFTDFAALETYTATTAGTNDANRINVTDQCDAKEVFVVGTLDSNNVVTSISVAFIRLNGEWVAVATNIRGDDGEDGATLKFPSEAARDTFFTSRPDLLANGLPILVRTAGVNTTIQVWTGTTSPSSYTASSDAVRWATSTLQVGTGSLLVGPSFTLSNGVLAVALSLADGTKALGLNVEYDDTGSTEPFYYRLSAQQILNVNTTNTQDITDPFELAYTTVGDNLTVDFQLIPAEAGQCRVRFWEGTDDTGDVIFDEFRTFTAAEVGNVQTFGVGNPYLFPAGTQIFVRFEGISFRGGVAGVNDALAGQTTIYFVSEIMPWVKTPLGGGEFSPVVTEISSDITITAANVSTYIDDSNFAILELFNSTGTIHVRIDDDAFEEGQFLRIKHFDFLANPGTRFQVESTGTDTFEHPERDTLESDVNGEMDNAYTWRKSGTDWFLDSWFNHGDVLFDDDDRTKLDGIDPGAEVNVQSDWDETDTTDDAFILNKPTVLGEDNYVQSIIGTLTAANRLQIDLDRTGSLSGLATSVDLSGLDEDNYADSLTLDCTNNTLTVTIGRTGSLSDLVATCSLDGMTVPSLSAFTTGIASRVDLNTDLNVATALNYTVTNSSLLTALELLVTTGDNKTLTVPTTDGSQSESATLSGIDTSADATLTLRLSGTYSGGTVMSNTVTINIRDAFDHEQVHFGLLPQGQGVSAIDFATTDTSTANQTAGDYTVTGIPTDSTLHRIYWAVPADFDDVINITQSFLTITNQFTQTEDHTIDGRDYNIWLLNDAVAVNSNFNSTVLTLGV